MKKIIFSVNATLAALVFGSEFSQANTLTSNKVTEIRSGVSYLLTPASAEVLNINFTDVKESLNLKEYENIVFCVEQNGEIDLSIYDNATFGSMRTDGVIK